MDKKRMLQCRYCCADILYSEDAKYVRCIYCGRQMELPSSTEEEKSILKAIEEAKNASENAEHALIQSTESMKHSAEEAVRQTAEKLKSLLSEAENKKIMERRERLMGLYQKAAELQRAGRFEDAAAEYRAILKQDPAEAEACWQLVLCRYGVEYIADENDGEYVPTISHLREESIFDDVDYSAALKYAGSDEMRAYYEREAERIDRTLTRYIQIREKEACDIFISVKQADSMGNPTNDSLLAQDLYHLLTNEFGLRVFNSRISLQSHAGEEWEPYIMSALMSAKLMIVVGTKPAHFTSPWVRNEWRRFRWLMTSEKKDRILLPCVSSMTPSELPKEMGYLQAVNLNDLNGKDALVHTVAGIFGRDVHPTEAKNAVVGMTGAFKLLEAKDWDGANAAVDKMLELDEAKAAAEGAYYAKLMCEQRANSLSALRRRPTPLENSPFYARALQYADETLRGQLQACNLEIIQRGIAGDVWGRIQDESKMLKDVTVGAGLAPIFREAYEQNGAALEIYKNDFNDYMNRCRRGELAPVQSELKTIRTRIAQLEKKCTEHRQWISGKDGKADKMHEEAQVELKGRSWLSSVLWVLLIFGIALSVYAVIYLWFDVYLVYGNWYGRWFPDGAHIGFLVGVIWTILSLILFRTTRVTRARQRERSAVRRQKAQNAKGVRAKELQFKMSSMQDELVSMEKSIANYKINLAKLEEQEKIIQDKYPIF